MTDDIIFDTIKTYWLRVDRNEWEICLLAAQVVGKRDGATQRIAEDCGVKVDTVERRARAGRAYLAIEKSWPKEAIGLKRQLKHTYFEAVGRAVENQLMGWQSAYEYLMDAAQDGIPIERFRWLMPGDNTSGSYLHLCQKIIIRLDKDIINNSFLNAPHDKAVKVRQAAIFLKDAISDMLYERQTA